MFHVGKKVLPRARTRIKCCTLVFTGGVDSSVAALLLKQAGKTCASIVALPVILLACLFIKPRANFYARLQRLGRAHDELGRI